MGKYIMKTFKEHIISKHMLKEKNDGIIFTFGRFNPPTKGHEENINELKKMAKKYKLQPQVYASTSYDDSCNSSNPLQFEYKISILKKLFKGVYISSDKNLKNAFQILQELGKKYSKIYFMVGDDRKDEFYNAMKNYIDEYGISDFKVISSGKRTKGVSATEQRKYAADNNFLKFYKNVPSTCNVTLAKEIFNTLKKVLYCKDKK